MLQTSSSTPDTVPNYFKLLPLPFGELPIGNNLSYPFVQVSLGCRVSMEQASFTGKTAWKTLLCSRELSILKLYLSQHQCGMDTSDGQHFEQTRGLDTTLLPLEAERTIPSPLEKENTLSYTIDTIFNFFVHQNYTNIKLRKYAVNCFFLHVAHAIKEPEHNKLKKKEEVLCHNSFCFHSFHLIIITNFTTKE